MFKSLFLKHLQDTGFTLIPRLSVKGSWFCLPNELPSIAAPFPLQANEPPGIKEYITCYYIKNCEQNHSSWQYELAPNHQLSPWDRVWQTFAIIGSATELASQFKHETKPTKEKQGWDVFCPLFFLQVLKIFITTEFYTLEVKTILIWTCMCVYRYTYVYIHLMVENASLIGYSFLREISMPY